MVKRMICTCLVQIKSADQDTEKSLTDAIATTHRRGSTESLTRKHTGYITVLHRSQSLDEEEYIMHNKSGLLTNVKWELSHCEYLGGEVGSRGEK